MLFFPFEIMNFGTCKKLPYLPKKLNLSFLTHTHIHTYTHILAYVVFPLRDDEFWDLQEAAMSAEEMKPQSLEVIEEENEPEIEERPYEEGVFNLRVVFEKNKTGFEESKEFHAEQGQVCVYLCVRSCVCVLFRFFGGKQNGV